MNDDIIRMAREAGFMVGPSRDGPDDVWGIAANLKDFAALVLANNPPQSSMAWQEGFEAGRVSEREACAKYVDHILKENGGTYGDAIRSRGNT